MYRAEGTDRLNRRPAWAWLYASAAVALAPVFLVARYLPEGALRTVLEAAAALILIWALALWARADRIELELQGRRDSGWRRAMITGAPPARPAELPSTDGAGPGGRPELMVGGRRHALDRKDFHHEGFAFVHRG
jgi:hypothetical protein